MSECGLTPAVNHSVCYARVNAVANCNLRLCERRRYAESMSWTTYARTPGLLIGNRQNAPIPSLRHTYPSHLPTIHSLFLRERCSASYECSLFCFSYKIFRENKEAFNKDTREKEREGGERRIKCTQPNLSVVANKYLSWEIFLAEAIKYFIT